MRGNNPRFFGWYVFGLLLTRLSVPVNKIYYLLFYLLLILIFLKKIFKKLYFRGCPYNLRLYKPSTEFCVAYTIITIF